MTYASLRDHPFRAAAIEFVENGFDRTGETHPDHLSLAWKKALNEIGHDGNFSLTVTRPFRQSGRLGKTPLAIMMSGSVPELVHRFALRISRLLPEYLDRDDEALALRVAEIMHECAAQE